MEWQGALSKKSTMFLCLRCKRWFSERRMSSIILLVIHLVSLVAKIVSSIWPFPVFQMFETTMLNSMANNYRIFFSTCSIHKICPNVSLLGLLAATASFSVFSEANVWKTLPKAPSLVHVPEVLWLPSLNQLFGSFLQLSSVRGLKSASSPATATVEILCAFLKRSNHPSEATKPSTCSFSAITKPSSQSIVPGTGILEDLQRQYHSQTASLTSAYLPDLCRFNPFLWLFSYASRISCFSFMMVCIWVLPTANFLASFR